MKKKDDDNSIFSIFSGLDRFIGIMADMVDNEKDEVNVNGDLNSDNEKVKGKYGFNIRLGPGTVSSPDKKKAFDALFEKKNVPPKTVEPVTDVFEDEDGVMIVAELPGVDRDDIGLNLTGNSVTLTASKNGSCYLKKVELKFSPDPGSVRESFNNSIYSVSLKART